MRVLSRLECQVERRLGLVGQRDRAGALRAVGGVPGPPEPVGRIQPRPVEAGERLWPSFGDAAEDGVGQPREALSLRQGAHGRHRFSHRRMARRAEEEELRRPGPQRMAHRIGWGAAEIGLEHGIERAEAA